MAGKLSVANGFQMGLGNFVVNIGEVDFRQRSCLFRVFKAERLSVSHSLQSNSSFPNLSLKLPIIYFREWILLSF